MSVVPFKPNMNFDDVPEPQITKQMISNLEEVAILQDDFGMKKYGKPLDHTMHYDWMEMFLQEAADGMKYIQCEINRKNDVIALLESALRVDEPKVYIQSALEQLKISGTGK